MDVRKNGKQGSKQGTTKRKPHAMGDNPLVWQKLAKVILGLALMHIDRTKNDMNMGPKLMKQVYNSQLINNQTMSRIDNYNKSAGLRNHYAAYAI